MRTNELVMMGEKMVLMVVSTRFTEPAIDKSYYPIHSLEANQWNGNSVPSVGDEVEPGNQHGSVFVHSCSDPRTHRPTGRVIVLGSSDPVAVVTEAVARPRSKLPVRWHDGAWQKLLKSGWRDV